MVIAALGAKASVREAGVRAGKREGREHVLLWGAEAAPRYVDFEEHPQVHSSPASSLAASPPRCTPGTSKYFQPKKVTRRTDEDAELSLEITGTAWQSGD